MSMTLSDAEPKVGTEAGPKIGVSRAWTPEFDAGRHWRGHLGFVLISNEAVIEDDLKMMAPPGVGIHFTRAAMPNECTVDSLASMEAGLAEAASNLLPGRHVEVVCYACTSGSVVIGEERVAEELKRGAPDSKTTSLVTGVIAGLRAMEARRIVIATPYLDEINALEADYFVARGFDVLDIQGLQLTYDTDMNRVTPAFLADFAEAIDRPDAEAVFISCGGIRGIEAIEETERRVGKPVITSNQAMFWHCLRLAGIDDRIEGYGRLFREH
jgi:maleate isomerase